MGVTDDSNLTPTNLIVDPTTKRLKCSATLSGTVPLANGGTGTGSMGTGYAVVVVDATGTSYLTSLIALGTSGQVLTSNGAGAFPSWSAAGAGITELNGLSGAAQRFLIGTAGSGFNISSAGTTHTFNLPTASASGTGQLTGTDWTTFNNKVATSRLINTTLPLSGGGDLSNDRTLSISVASASGSGYLKGEDWTSFNSRGSILTFSLPLSVSVTNVSISKATSTGSGYLSGEDWTSFNSRGSILTFSLPLSVSGTAVSISVSSASGSGYLKGEDWNTFNTKLASLGGLITATQEFAVGNAGAQFNIVSSGSTHTFNLPTASASGTGQLTGGAFTTFNAKANPSLSNLNTTTSVNASLLPDSGVNLGSTGSAWGTTYTNYLQINNVAYFDTEYSNGSTTTAGGTAINWNNGNKQFMGMASTTAIAFTQNPPAPCNLVLRLLQDGTGSRVITWPTTGGIIIRWSGGTILSTGANKQDVASFYYAGGSTYYGMLSTNFATY